MSDELKTAAKILFSDSQIFFMKRNFYALIFCILVTTQISCERTETNSAAPRTQTKTVETTESPSPIKTEETETNKEEIKIGREEAKADYPNLKTQADRMGAAFSANDFDEFTDYMYPKLIEAAGGRDKFISTLNASMDQAKSTGFELGGYEIGEPTPAIEIDNQIFSVLPTKTTMKFPSKTVTEQGSILAVSEDKGESWKFVRVKSKENIRPLFPKAIDKLTFPETTTTTK